MFFTERIFDIKKCARALRRQPGAPAIKSNPDALTPKGLKSCMYSAYIQVLRDETINIRELDFDAIGDGDIDDLENVLYYSPAGELFEIGEVFKSLAPSCTDKRVFI